MIYQAFAEKHMQCVFFMFNDNLFALSHSVIIARLLLTPSWMPVASRPLENRLVSSANSTGMVFLQTVQRSLI